MQNLVNVQRDKYIRMIVKCSWYKKMRANEQILTRKSPETGSPRDQLAHKTLTMAEQYRRRTKNMLTPAEMLKPGELTPEEHACARSQEQNAKWGTGYS